MKLEEGLYEKKSVGDPVLMDYEGRDVTPEVNSNVRYCGLIHWFATCNVGREVKNLFLEFREKASTNHHIVDEFLLIW